MRTNYVVFLLSIITYFLIAYEVSRSDFLIFITLFSGAFIFYLYWCNKASKLFVDNKINQFIFAAIILRLIFTFEYPALSDDFWRYLWDGRLLYNGYNPYAYLPSELINHYLYETAELQQLYPHLNSTNFYSVYPPLTQCLFFISSFLFDNNIGASLFVLHLITIAFEVGTIIMVIKILKIIKKPVHLAFFYAFNPLVIIELSGNLHTEAAMIFFLSLALYFLLKNQLTTSAFVFALAVNIKLLPLIFLPLILCRLWFKEGIKYCTIVLGVTALLFLLFIDIELVGKIQSSISLYFNHFEFNASIYYLARYGLFNEYWQLWDFHKYFMNVQWLEDFLREDIYGIIRKTLPILDILIIFIISFNRSNRNSIHSFFKSMLFIYSIHFFLATTIHPWYITPLIMIGVFTSFRFVILWSFLITLTYISYSGTDFTENYYIIITEYLFVIGVLLYEVFNKKELQL
ncbi:MAG: glycosyltransferase 87 family protein [Saprospiraceae bacterium]|nr:glycosyltransferase 87 family protein [Saprospiraceae bacterium]